MNFMEKSIRLHEELNGKIEIRSKMEIKTKQDLSLLYTPGVAYSSLAIKDDPNQVYKLTGKNNMVAVISDGSAVLGLGNIGPLAAIPVMEGKCAIFKEFAGVNAIPIVLDTQDVNEIINTITHIAPSFGGINLEDISAPRCFEIETRLKGILDIPVFHDDQHGTAIACGAALINALKLVKKDLEKVQIVINGAGSAGCAITNFLLKLGAKNLMVCDKMGSLRSNDKSLNPYQTKLASLTNFDNKKETLQEAMIGADVFIGVSTGHIVSKSMVRSMNKDAIVFAMANPTPEINQEDAISGGARIYGAGLSNVPNQINNALVFPGIFKGALEARVKDITPEIEVAVCKAISEIIPEKDLREDYIIPSVFDERVSQQIVQTIIKDFGQKK